MPIYQSAAVVSSLATNSGVSKSTLGKDDFLKLLVQQLKAYTDASVIGVRPHHPQFVEALTILEDTAAAYLTKQISIEESMNQAKEQLATLG